MKKNPPPQKKGQKNLSPSRREGAGDGYTQKGLQAVQPQGKSTISLDILVLIDTNPEKSNKSQVKFTEHGKNSDNPGRWKKKQKKHLNSIIKKTKLCLYQH